MVMWEVGGVGGVGEVEGYGCIWVFDEVGC